MKACQKGRSMTMTIEEAARELAARLDITPPAGWPENIDSTKAEFRLSFGRLQQMSDLKTKLLELANNRTLRTRYPDGWHLPEESEVSESSQVDIAEAQAALEELGKKFVPEGIPLSAGAPESTESPAPITLSEGKRGITKAEILDAEWPLPNDAPSLESILNKIPKWVDEACIKVGRAGKGQSGSHLWSPAVLAVCLATRTPHKQWICNQAALTNLLRSQFPDYLDEWTKKQEML